MLFAKNNHNVCSACRGAWHNKPYVGLPIIWGLTQKGDKWVHGKVLDVDSGKVYQCYLVVSPNNTTLYFSAYVGLPLFGATLKWDRVG